jgi:hypothetical protein
MPLSPMLTSAEIRSSLNVYEADAGGDIGDPFRWCDFAARPDATVAIVQRRLTEQRTPRHGHVFRWPKEKGAEYRPMAWLDPIDQLTYRASVGRLVPPVAAALDVDSVMSFRLARRHYGWELENWRRGNPVRQARSKELLKTHPVMGAMDIQNFYPTVRRPALEGILGQLPVPERTLGFVLDWLDELETVSTIRGLPTGHDASSVLAHGLLIPLDTMLSRLRVPFVRWVDDTWFFVDDLSEYGAIVEAYGRALSLLGLVLHPTKTQPYVGFEALHVIENSAIQYLGEALNDPGPEGLAAGMELFEFAMAAPEERKTELRKALTTLSKHRHLMPLEALRNNTDLLRLGIAQWVIYLRALLSQKNTRHAVGDDWLLDQITRDVTQDHGYTNLCFLRASAEIQLAKSSGSRIFDLACSDGAWSSPIRVWAAHNWGRSQDFSHGKALEQVEEQGEYSTRRAFACTLGARRGDRRMATWTKRIRRAEPELEPTAAWLEVA